MASLPRTYTDSTTHARSTRPRARLGGPRPSRTRSTHEDWFERFANSFPFGSHMPLDTEPHWEWSNPLNVIPATIILVIVIALISAIL